MKKILISFYIAGTLLTSCGNSKSEDNIKEQPKKELSFEEKIKEVCDCFSSSKGDRMKRMGCFQLQDEFWKELDGDSIKQIFLQESNKCIDQ